MDAVRRPPCAALLPLYLELYDEVCPQVRSAQEAWVAQVADALRQRGLDVWAAPVGRREDEVRPAVTEAQARGVDAIVTLHLAYSPSLAAADALCETALPLVMLDTTPDFGFGEDPARLMNNHGIHGVQDLASVLRRRGRAYDVCAGHWERSDVLDRVGARVQGAAAARRLHGMRALRIGPSFAGMGDFAVDAEELRARFGVEVAQRTAAELAAAAAGIEEEAVRAEVEADRQRFDVRCEPAAHAAAVRVGLGLRRLLDDGRFGAMSLNFLCFDTPQGAAPMAPFLEACKAMARGVGYAGEGDVLGACLTGALLAVEPRTTFTEMFCPDWRGGRVLLAHMGEVNPRSVAGRPQVRQRPFPFTPAMPPAIVTGCCAPGPALLVNLAPGPDGSFGLVAAPVEVLPEPPGAGMDDQVRGWFRPRPELPAFLEAYSRAGGTHHLALVPGGRLEMAAALAQHAGMAFHAVQ